MTKQVQQLDHVIIRFAGDSGDGKQLDGDRFTAETAIFGNVLSTLPRVPCRACRVSNCISLTTTS